MAERSVKTVKDLLTKESSLEDVLLAYRATPLASGFSPVQLMFGRRIRSKVGLHVDQKTDYTSFERLNESAKAFSKKKWDSKRRALQLPELMVGLRVWVNAPQDRGSEGVVVRKDDSPHRFWVRVGPSFLRRKRLALLPERVSPGVIRDEDPKRVLTPETGVSSDFTGCTFAYPNSPQVGVRKGLQTLKRILKRTLNRGTLNRFPRKLSKSPLAFSRAPRGW